MRVAQRELAQLSTLLLLAGACGAAEPCPDLRTNPPIATVSEATSSAVAPPPATSAAPAVSSSSVPSVVAAAAPSKEESPLLIDLAEAVPPNKSCAGGPTPFVLSVLVDRSGSMTGVPMDMAKKAVRELVSSLQPNEAVEVIAFDSSPSRAVELSCGSQRNEARIQIDAIKPGGGTELLSPLKLAFIDLVATRAARKHLVLITDGRASIAGVNELAAIMASSGITVSTVGLGGDIDVQLLTTLASATGGSFHSVADPKELEATLAKDLAAARKQSKR